MGFASQAPLLTIPSLCLAEGVLYAQKDYNLPKHPEVDVPNLQVIKLMQSFKSRELVVERFSWRHFYWYLTDTGIDYLREYLSLPSEIVPATLKKTTRAPGRPMGDRPMGDGPRRDYGDRRSYGDREGYRGMGRSGDKPGGAPGEYRPSFQGGRGGFGRGGGFGAPRE